MVFGFWRIDMENWHTRNKEKGLCPDCGAVKENPESYCCDKCKAYHHNYYVESKEFFISHGICPKCGKERLYGSYKSCDTCREKRRETRKSRPKTQEEKDRAKMIYYDRKSKGLCTQCGKQAYAGRTLCARHLVNDRARVKYSNVLICRKLNNQCLWCEKPVADGRLYCYECLERKAKLAEYARSCRNMDNHVWKNDNKLIFQK